MGARIFRDEGIDPGKHSVGLEERGVCRVETTPLYPLIRNLDDLRHDILEFFVRFM